MERKGMFSNNGLAGLYRIEDKEYWHCSVVIIVQALPNNPF